MKYGGKADVGYKGGRREKFKTLSKPFNSFHPTLRFGESSLRGDPDESALYP